MALALSLRVRLTLWFVLVFVVLQTGLIVAAVYLRQDAVRATVDDQALDQARGLIENLVNHVDHEQLDDLPNDVQVLLGLVPTDGDFLGWAFRDESGEVLVEWNVEAETQLPFGSWEEVPSGPVGPVFTPLGPTLARAINGDANELRLMTLPLRIEGKLRYFQAVTDVVLTEHLLGAALDLLATGVPVGLLVSMLAAWLIAGRAVSPLRQVSRAARAVSPERIDERVSLPASGPEVSRLQRDLNAALERLEQGYRAQDQFISNVSHELRTPISVLLTEAQVCRLSPDPDAEARRFLDHAERELQRLGRLVTSILSLARLENALEREHPRVQPNDLVLEAVQHASHGAQQAGVHLVPQLLECEGEEPALRGDEDLLQTLLDNLVRNAVLHSPRGGRVHVRAALEEGSLRLDVSDEGPGVPEEYLARVFDRFTQAPSGRERGGTGIGLAIARRVTELHGGVISAANHVGRPGCTFTVRLPVAWPEAA